VPGPESGLPFAGMAIESAPGEGHDQLARKRILALKRLVAQRQVEGDRACIEGIEIMGFLATLVGLTTVERFIPLATPETERRDVLAAKPAAAPPARTVESRRTAEQTRQMTALTSKAERVPAAQRTGAPARPTAAPVARQVRREQQRAPAPKPRKPPTSVTQTEHLVIADAVRLLGWGRQWHELAEMIARLSERPAPSEIRRILRTYREQIDAIVSRRES
jgi:hypothetical protein